MWLSKPIYELLPYGYLVAGLAALIASMYLSYWYWPMICLALGFGLVIAGLMVLLKRRDFRHHRRSTQ